MTEFKPVGETREEIVNNYINGFEWNDEYKHLPRTLLMVTVAKIRNCLPAIQWAVDNFDLTIDDLRQNRDFLKFCRNPEILKYLRDEIGYTMDDARPHVLYNPHLKELFFSAED